MSEAQKSIYFVGIGGSGISSLAHLCIDLGYQVYGSNTENNFITENLKLRGALIITPKEFLELKVELDYLICTSAVKVENYPKLPAKKIGKRDLLINEILQDHNLKLIAVAGTHGKTTTSSMLVWLFQESNIPFAHIIGSTLKFAQSGGFKNGAKYLILEADEYDRHFLNYNPEYSIITSIEHDHPDIYPTEIEYFQAFGEFINNSKNVFLHPKDYQKLLNHDVLLNAPIFNILDFKTNVAGRVFRENANLALSLFANLFPKIPGVNIINSFPGADRRSEIIAERIISDYAHHPTEIKATINLLKERYPDKYLTVIYLPHQNLRQIMIKDLYKGAFLGVDTLFWMDTYLSRENNEDVLSALELSSYANHPNTIITKPGNELINKLRSIHQDPNNIIVLMTAGEDGWFLNNINNIIN